MGDFMFPNGCQSSRLEQYEKKIELRTYGHRFAAADL
jgi:hypothetical protein